MDENKKVVVNLPEGTTQAEIIVREGEAPAVLDPKAPVKNRPYRRYRCPGGVLGKTTFRTRPD